MKRKISVIHIITQLAIGGAQENTILTASLADKERFSSMIISGNERCPEGNLIDEVARRGIHHYKDKFLVRPINPLKDALCLVSLIRNIQKYKGTIIHTHSSKAGILGRIAAYFAGSKVTIHTVHGWSYHGHMKIWKKKLFVFLERITEKLSDKLICVTDRDISKGLYERIGTPYKYAIIRSGFEVKRFREKVSKAEETKKNFGLPLNKKIVGTVGRISQQKDLETFVNVAKIVSKKRDDVIFVIVGGGERRKKIENRISELNLKKAVFLLGAQRDVEKIFQIFDVFLLTSLWEGLPKVIPQAMAAGVPVVSTAINGVKEVIKHGETGLLAETGDVEKLAEHVISLFDDDSTKERIVSNSKPIAEQFDAAIMVKNIENLYSELLKSRKRL